jgi:WD40 repeat protein
VSRIQFSPDGKYLFAGDWGGTIQIWQMPGRQPLHTLKESFAAHFIVSPDRKLMAYLDGHNITRLIFLDITSLLNPETNSTIAPYIVENGYLKFAFSFSPDSKILLWGENYNFGIRGTIQLWDVQNRTILATLEGHKAPVSFLGFSPDGRHIVSSSYDGTIRLWGLND